MRMNQESDSYFDLQSLLDDDSQLYSDAFNGDTVEKFEDIADGKGLSLPLDVSWMNNFVSVGRNGNKYTNNLMGQSEPTVNDTTYSSALESKTLLDEISSTPIPSPCLSSSDKPMCVSDDELLKLSVKELNRVVKALPKPDVKEIKQRRRTLKNRGYARSCRVKRQEEKSSLEQNNGGLEIDIKLLKLELKTVVAERDEYKKKYENLLRERFPN